MKTQVRKNERVLNLLAYLLRSRAVAPFEEIRRNVDGYNDTDTAAAAVARRFERDKTTLRSLGVDVIWAEDPLDGRLGYLIRKSAAYMGDVTLCDREVRLLSVLASFGREKSAALLANLASACQKLLARSPLHEPAVDMARCHLIYPARTATNRTLLANLELFANALEKRRRVAFTYYSISRDATSSRLVEPYGVKFFRGEWYLVGRCLEADAARIFRLDRITGKAAADGAAGAYDVPRDFSISDYVGRSPWQLSRRDGVEVIVELDNVGAWLVEEARPAGLALERSGSGGIATVEMRNPEGFFKWLLPLGTHARIKAPREVADAFAEFVRGLIR